MRDHTRRGPRRSRAGGRRVRHAADGSGCSGRAARVGRRCSHAAGVARAAAAIRHRHQGRQEDRWRTDDLAKGRQGLDRADARGLRQADVVRAQDRTRHRRGGAVRRHDDRSVRPLWPTAAGGVQARAQPGAAAGAQHRVHGARQDPRGARHRSRLLAQPAGHGRGGEPAASGAQVDPDRSEQPVHHRHAGRGHRAAAAVPPGLRVRRPQHVVHRGARQARPGGVRGQCALRDAQHRRASTRHARHAARPGAVDPAGGARCAQPVSRFALRAGQAARAADGGAQGRPARGLLRHRAPGLQRRPGAHAACAPDQPLAPGEEGSDCSACPSR